MKGFRTVTNARSGGSGGHLNVTPLIDIVMVLIIFFLLVGQLAMDRQGIVDLPEATTGEQATPGGDPIAIAIAADGGLAVDGRTTQSEKLDVVLEVLRRQRPLSPVQIRADRATPYAAVRTVLETVRGSGITDVELATKASSTAGRAGDTP